MLEERGRQREHLYRSRHKTGGWYGRRFGKNPRWADVRGDAYRDWKREKDGKPPRNRKEQ